MAGRGAIDDRHCTMKTWAEWPVECTGPAASRALACRRIGDVLSV